MKERMVLDDVAKALGVSNTTVSRAISGTGRISKQTRERVLAYVSEIGYIPNASASNLSRSRTRNLAYVMPLNEQAVMSSYFLECLFGVVQAARERGYNVIVVDDSVEELCHIAGSQKVDGLVLSGFTHGDAVMKRLVGYRLPVVLIGSCDVPGVKLMSYDAHAAYVALTDYLMETWKTSVGLILANRQYPANVSRAEGFRAAMSARSEPTPHIRWDAVGKEQIAEAMVALYREGVRGVICGDDSICSDLLSVLAAFRWGQDEELRRMANTVRLASFHSNRLLHLFHPEIPSVVMEPETLGEHAARLAITDIEEGNAPASTMAEYKLNLP